MDIAIQEQEVKTEIVALVTKQNRESTEGSGKIKTRFGKQTQRSAHMQVPKRDGTK